MNEYFTDKELACKCCGAKNIDPDFRRRLNVARDQAGFAFVISSAYRCEKHNTEEGSTSTNHVRGKAADIRCINDRKRYAMVNALIIAGIIGIGIGKTFIHGDTNRTAPAIWLY